MNILGIDPGSRITGFGLITVNKLKFTYINSGCIRTQGDLNDRVVTIYSGIKEILEKHKVDIVVIERVFMRPDRPNPDAAIKLGHARGAVISAAGGQVSLGLDPSVRGRKLQENGGAPGIYSGDDADW